jgi:hypothetical protein
MATYSKSAKSSRFRISCSVWEMTPVADVVTGKVYTTYTLMFNSAFSDVLVLEVCKLPEFAQHHWHGFGLFPSSHQIKYITQRFENSLFSPSDEPSIWFADISYINYLNGFHAVKYHRQAMWTKQWAQSNWESLQWMDCLWVLFYSVSFVHFRQHPSAYSQRVLNQIWNGHKLRSDVNCQAELN